jgi:hypothetical protein
MLLDKFNDRLNAIELDSVTGEGRICIKGEANVSGVGEKINKDTVALFVSDNKLIFILKGKVFNVTDNDININYSHDGQGYTKVSIIENGKEVFEYTYPSWWIRNLEAVPAGLGRGDDEDEDFIAYVKLMIEGNNRKEHFLRKYSLSAR